MPDDPVKARPFGVRFDEAIGFLRDKLPEASEAWDSLAGPVHAKVFTVAGATTADLAADIQRSLVEALANGETLTDFRKGFDAAVAKHGWAYNGKRGWRTAVIFNTNMRSAHMAGRWQQLQANKDRRPFLQYRTAGDARVRPQHRAWNGTIRPIDDAFWLTHYPPNGWGCRCTVRALSQADLDERNLQVSPPPKIETRDVVAWDGTLTDRVPKGIDPGWDHNVGRAWVKPELALGQKLASLPRELQGALVDKTISPAFQTVLNERWTAHRSAVKVRSTAAEVGAGEQDAQIVGFLDSAVLDGLGRLVPGLQLQSTALAVVDNTVAGRAAWPADWVDALPAELVNYSAAVWDAEAGRLLLVPQGSFALNGAPRQGVAVIRPDAVTNLGPALGVESLDAVAPAVLAADPNRYRVIAGRVR